MKESAGNNKITFYGFIIYILILLIYAFLLPSYRFDPYQKSFIFIIGLIGVWRYGWFLTNITRAYLYKNYKFKKIRAKERSMGEELDPEHLFLLITSFRITTEVTIESYREAIKDAIRSGYNTTIIASIVEKADEHLIRRIFLLLNPPENIKLVIARIKGSGKRDALATGYRVVKNTSVNHFKSIVAVIDGDSIVTPNTFRKCCRLFGLDDELGGLTTDEQGRLIREPKTISEHIYYRWYRLRFAQRNIAMSSISLSDRILTLTGRMSMVRASIVIEKDFIDTVQLDHINHWRLGTFQFLTGDDKSSLYDLMKGGWKMLYVPDALVHTIDEIVNENFVAGSLELMSRWFGNQYRTNSRQLKIPNARKVVNTFPWYAIIDQRITRWMTPYGFFIALFASIHWGWQIFLGYTWWILLSRLLMAFAYRSSKKEIFVLWPFLLYYNQLVGSIVKIYIWEHLYKQSWTRQKTKLAAGKRFVEWYYRVSSNGMLMIDWLVFLIGISVLVKLITFDDMWLYFNTIKNIL